MRRAARLILLELADREAGSTCFMRRRRRIKIYRYITTLPNCERRIQK